MSILQSCHQPIPQAMEGQVIVVKAADLVQSRRLIPDYATWSQCFALYVAAVASHQPERLPDLMAYQALIVRASKKYRWPSWLVYDQNFRQEAAGNRELLWAKADPSMYAQCFTCQELSGENWCSRCQGLDHTSASCPYQSRKRQWNALPLEAGSQPPRGKARVEQGRDQVCMKFNRYQGDCWFGCECKFRHVCSACYGSHPVSKCRESKSE